MRNRPDSRITLLKLLLAGVIAAMGAHAHAQSNCVNGPAADAAGADADLTDLTIFACAISSDPANCDNPGKQPHRIFWNSTLLASGNLGDELVVILPGAANNPEAIEWLGKAAGYAGYRTIVLAYEGDTLESACGTAIGAAYNSCTRDFRKDVILGTPAAPASATDVHRANSAELRLLDLLADLNAKHPADGWGQYSTAPAVLSHDKIIISGWSLGSGHAAFWASLEKFAGVVTFSGPTDSSCFPFEFDRTLHPGLFYPLGCTNTLADWIRENPTTPGTLRYGAFHAHEAVFPKLDVITRAWDNFGLPRLPGNHLVLDVTNGYDFKLRQPWPLTKGEHRFSFNTPIPDGCDAHDAAASDSCLETDVTSNLPLVFPLYMNMYCAAAGDLP